MTPLAALLIGAAAVALPAFWLAVARRARQDLRAAKAAVPKARAAFRTAALIFAGWATVALVVLAAAIAAARH